MAGSRDCTGRNETLALERAGSARSLLARILETPDIARVIPRLLPDTLHRVIQTCGLEDCGDLVAMATAGQLQQIFDLDLWHAAAPGLDQRLDAQRFAVWLEVLMESGAPAAAQKLATFPLDLVVVALAQHVRVFDLAAIPQTHGEDDMLLEEARPSERDAAEIGGYRIESIRSDGWDTIVQLLVELQDGHPACFHALMRGCRSLSNAGAEPDGFHDLLSRREQDMFDLETAREERRVKQGYVTPAQARAFLQQARRVNLSDAEPPGRDPIAVASIRSLEHADLTRAEEHGKAPSASAERDETNTPAVQDEPSHAFEVVIDLLRESGVLTLPRALLGSGLDAAPRARLLQGHLQFAFERDPRVCSMRTEELAFLANAVLAGCSVLGRPFTAAEASDAAAAICNLGLENWPPRWHTGATHTSSPTPIDVPAPEDFLLHQDLVGVFQVGWSTLYREVTMYAAERLIDVLTGIECVDRDIQLSLAALRRELSRDWRGGEPWQAARMLDAIMPLDMTAWATLLALIAECPVLHAAIGTARGRAPRTIDVSAFEFISTNAQIADIRVFFASLPKRLVS
jgi:hypothetical protein